MDYLPILIGSGALAGVGAVSAGILSVASRVFAVEEDPRITAVLEMLPGANCGGCGYPGCAGLANAIIAGKAEPSKCAPASAEAVANICAFLGMEASSKTRMIARVRCVGTPEACPSRFEYKGVSSCKAAVMINEGGAKACPYGCEGLGDCVEVCLFDAIHMGPNHLPIVDDKCTACGNCVTACPKGIIALEPYDSHVSISCSSQWPGKLVRQTCSVGCITCQACVRACPYEAITMDGNLPVIDYAKCRACGLCVDACKPGCIVVEREIDPVAKAEAEELSARIKAEKAAAKKALAEKVALAKTVAERAVAAKAPENKGDGPQTN